MVFSLILLILSACPLGSYEAPNHFEAGDPHRSAPAFSIHYVVDRMVYHKAINKDGAYSEPWLYEPLAERYSLTYQAEANGDFFLEILPLPSPWLLGVEGGGVTYGPHDASRILITKNGLSVFNAEGNLIFSQELKGMEWEEGFFGETENPWKFRELLLLSGSIEVTRNLIEAQGAIVLPDGTLSLQSCGQSGPFRISCQPGICTRLIFDPIHLRPVLAEHSEAGHDPFYCRYFYWSEDGSTLKKSFELEKVTLQDGQEILIEAVAHYYDFTIKVLN